MKEEINEIKINFNNRVTGCNLIIIRMVYLQVQWNIAQKSKETFQTIFGA